MLTDAKNIKESRIHPLQVLVGMKTYSQGKGDLGSMTWPVNSYITTALSTTFRQAFGNITPTGKRFMIGLDVSGSMSMGMCAGAKNINSKVCNSTSSYRFKYFWVILIFGLNSLYLQHSPDLSFPKCMDHSPNCMYSLFVALGSSVQSYAPNIVVSATGLAR